MEIKCQLDATGVFHCRSYCLLNMFRSPLCPSSGAQEYYTVVAACGISCCGFQVAGLVWSCGLCVRFAGCCSILQTGHITLSSTPDQLLEKTTGMYFFTSNACNYPPRPQPYNHTHPHTTPTTFDTPSNKPR